MLHYLVNLIMAILPPTRAFGFKRILWRLIGANVGYGTRICAGAQIWGGGLVTIGHDTWLGMNLVIIVPPGSEVLIGSNVDVGPDVMIECGSHDIGGPNRRAGKDRSDSIEIGPGTWIGCRATLLGGARIGAGSIVAAGAIVLPGEYPDNVLLKGVPACAKTITSKVRDPL